jgi:hypothetical protein
MVTSLLTKGSVRASSGGLRKRVVTYCFVSHVCHSRYMYLEVLYTLTVSPMFCSHSFYRRWMDLDYVVVLGWN